MQYRWIKLKICNSYLLIELYTLLIHTASRNITSIYTRKEKQIYFQSLKTQFRIKAHTGSDSADHTAV